jgi:hypothetical protein
VLSDTSRITELDIHGMIAEDPRKTYDVVDTSFASFTTSLLTKLK